jgi:hypothetical protein
MRHYFHPKLLEELCLVHPTITKITQLKSPPLFWTLRLEKLLHIPKYPILVNCQILARRWRLTPVILAIWWQLGGLLLQASLDKQFKRTPSQK